MKGLVIIGAGGHGRVVLDAARLVGLDILGFLDPAYPPGVKINGCPVLGAHERDAPPYSTFVVAIGDNAVRRRVSIALAPRLTSVIHPMAILSPFASVGLGTFVGAGAVVGTNAQVGAFCIINTCCSIDHDCVLADGTQVCPGAHFAEGVVCEDDVFVGTGANVIPKIRIGARAVIGAGATVISDIPADVTAVGVPAKIKQPKARSI